MAWTIEYYSEQLIEWIDALPLGIRASYAKITERMLVYGPNIGMPYTRAMGGGLFEVRPKGREGIARILYCTIVNQRMIMLHGFVKKTPKTPQHELDMARKRMEEIKYE